MSVLRRLDDFRGASRFTTWAYKFALLEAAVKLRKRAWQGREVPLEPETWALFSSGGPRARREAEQSELLAALQRAIDDVLTRTSAACSSRSPLNGVPIDVLAERLETTRGALYKTLHDARRKLRTAPGRRGLSLDQFSRRRHDRDVDLKQALGRCSVRRSPRSAATSASSSSTATSSSSWRARTPTRRSPGLRAHLDGCPACREEHESLRALVGGEQAL